MTATYRTTSIRPPRPIRSHGKVQKTVSRLVETVLAYALDAWTLMLLLGGLHSWQPRIPAVPFWPMLGLLYLLGSLIGFVVWVVVRMARVLLEDGDR